MLKISPHDFCCKNSYDEEVQPEAFSPLPQTPPNDGVSSGAQPPAPQSQPLPPQVAAQPYTQTPAYATQTNAASHVPISDVVPTAPTQTVSNVIPPPVSMPAVAPAVPTMPPQPQATQVSAAQAPPDPAQTQALMAAAQGQPQPTSTTALYGSSMQALAANEPPHSLPASPPAASTMWSAFKGLASFGAFVVSVVVLATFINLFVFQSYYVDGSSMHPTLEPDERLIINKVPQTVAKASGGHYTPKRGEIIVFNSELISPINGKPEQLIKRVIGLPGERVMVADEKITIYNDDNPNGFNPDELLGLKLAPTDGNIDIVIPKNEFFVSGDNRAPGGSYDSRSELGTVPDHRIVGELLIRLVPLNRAKVF